MTKTSLRSKEAGFTIVELMIALTVLSVMLIITTVTLVQIGKLYSKGINASNVQNATRDIMADISGALQFGGSKPYTCTTVRPTVVTADGSLAQGSPTCQSGHVTATYHSNNLEIYSFCISTTRYTYILDSQTSTSDTSYGHSYYGLWRDKMSSAATCNPVDLSQTGLTGGPHDANTVTGSGSELLPPRMSLTNFNVQEQNPGSGLYYITVGLAYGDHDLLGIDPSGNVLCNGGKGQEYCGTSILNTVITRRLP